MKKIVLAILLLGGIAYQSSAQVIRFIDNTFVTLGGGVDWYGNNRESFSDFQIGWPSLEVTGGKWVLNSVALRVGFNGFRATNTYDITSAAQNGTIKANNFNGLGDSTANASTLFFTGHFDLVWDIRSSFAGYQPYRSWNIFPVVGFGFVVRGANKYSHGDKDFLAFAGLNTEWAFAPHTMPNYKLFAEGKMFLFPTLYDYNKSLADIISLTAGIKYDINPMQYRKRKPGESRLVGDDWYLGLGAGLTLTQTHAFHGFDMNPLVDAELTIGKYLSSVVSIRLQGSFGLGGVDGGNIFTYLASHADVMLDVANIKYVVRNRQLSFLPYAGSGVISRIDGKGVLVSADLGVLMRVYISKTTDFFVDARYTMIPPRLIVDFDNSVRGSFSFGIPTLNFGFIRNLGVANCR